MKKSWLVGAILGIGWFASSLSAKDPLPGVAVFDTETLHIQLPPDLLDVLDGYLANRLVELGLFHVVPRSELHKQLAKDDIQPNPCLDQPCQIRAGQALGADKIFSTRILQSDNQCTVSAKLFDLKHPLMEVNTTVPAASCGEEALQDAMEQTVLEMVSKASEQALLLGMVNIPAGSFWMGCYPEHSSDCEKDESPGRMVFLDAYFIDRTEVTGEAYERCVSAHVCSAAEQGASCNAGKPGREQHPINCVRFDQADAYCRWAGKRLPSEAEWERAARGTDKRTYPWGEQPPTCAWAIVALGGKGCGKNSTWATCSKEKGNSPAGLCDAAGNVFEWTADWYQETAYQTGSQNNPPGPSAGEGRVLRGGSYSGYLKYLRTSFRDRLSPDRFHETVGFRCAKSVQK
jgi:formylglycine-generating enzyme